MKDNIKVTICFTIFLLFIIFSYIAYNSLVNSKINSMNNNYKTQENTGKEREKLKEFELYLENGKKVFSSDFLVGKPIVINIWTSWCGYCDIEMDYFEEVYSKNKDRVIFLMINATGDRDTKESAREYIENKGYTFDIYYDLYLKAISKLGVFSYPTTIFVDKDGNIESKIIGMITKQKLQSKIEELI